VLFILRKGELKSKENENKIIKIYA